MIGKTLGPYKVLEPLGAGGMGEVYLGEDTRLGRQVAVKVLPEEFAADPQRLARFEREARAAAALNHPHIAVVHDIGFEDDTHYIVQEYLKGRSLRERLHDGALPFDELLARAAEIAEALVAAHGAGIVHRDLKPDNIFITAENHAKVLDFGLAKLTEPVASAADMTQSPTLMATAAGQLMGTVGYMAPEQIEGGDVDGRTDLFAFGCVLYEMVAGNQPFSGKSMHDTLHRIGHEPATPLRDKRPDLPLRLEWIVDKCLAKDRRRRYQHAEDLVVDLKELGTQLDTGAAPMGGEQAGMTPSTPPTTAAPGLPMTTALPGAAAIAAIAAIAGWWLAGPATPSMPALPVVFDIPVETISNVALSPDGTTLVFRGRLGDEDDTRLFLRRMGVSDVVPIAGSEGARSHTLSPDGQWIAFWQTEDNVSVLRRASPDGLASDIYRAENIGPTGASWTDDDTIIFSAKGEVREVPITGGEPVTLTRPEEGQEGVRYTNAERLPGGLLLLQVESRVDQTRQVDVAVFSPDTGVTIIEENAASPRFLPAGYLFYGKRGDLWAVAFDPEHGATRGTPALVRQGIRAFSSMSHYDIADDGTLAYIPGVFTSGNTRDFRLEWINADGDRESAPIPTGRILDHRLSPDGRFVAVSREVDDRQDIYIYNVATGAEQRFTFEGERNAQPVWSPNGEWLYFTSRRNGGDSDIYRKRPEFSNEAPEDVLVGEGPHAPLDVSPNGNQLLYVSGSDLGAMSLGDDDAGDWTLETVAMELGGRFSPNGKYVAYASTETDPVGVHVRELATGATRSVAPGGGISPAWLPDGSLVYAALAVTANVMDGGGLMLSVSNDGEFVKLAIERDGIFDPSVPEPFIRGATSGISLFRGVDISPDGRILQSGFIDANDRSDEVPRVRVVRNFLEEVKRLTGGGAR